MCDMSTEQLLYLFESEYEGQDTPTEDELSSAINEIQGRTDNFYNEIVDEVITRLREGEFKEEEEQA
jgi:protoporphyrinogen oxidase